MKKIKNSVLSWIRVTVIIITALYETYAFATLLPAQLGQDIWFKVFGFSFMFFVIWHIYVLTTENQRYKNTCSNVVAEISKYATLEDIVYDRRKKGNRLEIEYTTKRYYLPLKQDKGKDRKLNLTNTDPVHAEITFYDNKLNKLRNLADGEAFWYNSKPRARAENPQDQDPIIRKSGKIEGVCYSG